MDFIKKIICFIFGHKWIWVRLPSKGSGEFYKSICDRCKKSANG